MDVHIEYEGGARFLVKAGAHTLVCDQPAANGGEDSGMTPPELLLASLGTCAGYYAAQYLNARKLTNGLKVDVSGEKAQNPARIGSFRIGVSVDGELDARHIEGITRAVHKCLIHNTLLNAPRIDLEVATNCIACTH